MADQNIFFVQLNEFVGRVKLAPSVVIKKVAFDLYGRIIKKTPVDTGRAQASWTIAVNKADRRVQPEGQPHYEPPPTPKLDVRYGDRVVISNNVEYIVALENGHSRKAPHGMVALSIAEVDAKMSRYKQEAAQEAGLS